MLSKSAPKWEGGVNGLNGLDNLVRRSSRCGLDILRTGGNGSGRDGSRIGRL